MSYKCFDLKIENNIAHVILNRPEKRNAMSADFWREFPKIIRDIDHGAKAHVIVVSSTGPHFSAGLDLSSFRALETHQRKIPTRKNCSVAPPFMTMCCIFKMHLPAWKKRGFLYFAVFKGALSGGVDLATACDIRYATEDAFLVIQETNIGMTADVGTFPRLVKLIPEGYVREMAYTGRRVSANEAKRMGLINEVYPTQETMLSAVMAIAAEIANKAPLAVYGCKRMINYARDHSTADGLDYIAIWNASMLKTEEIQEAISANTDGRPGDFASLPPSKKQSG